MEQDRFSIRNEQWSKFGSTITPRIKMTKNAIEPPKWSQKFALNEKEKSAISPRPCTASLDGNDSKTTRITLWIASSLNVLARFGFLFLNSQSSNNSRQNRKIVIRPSYQSIKKGWQWLYHSWRKLFQWIKLFYWLFYRLCSRCSRQAFYSSQENNATFHIFSFMIFI